jgi:hypothetical protein
VAIRNAQREAGAIVAPVPLTPEVMLDYGYAQGRFARKLLDRRRAIDARTPDTPLYVKPEKGLIKANVDTRSPGFTVESRIPVEYQDLAMAWLWSEETTDIYGRHPLRNATRDALETLVGIEALVAIRNKFRQLSEREEDLRASGDGYSWDIKKSEKIRDLQYRRRAALAIGEKCGRNTPKLAQKLDILGVPPVVAVFNYQRPHEKLEDHARKVKLGDLAPTPAFSWYNNHAGRTWDRSL